MLPLRFSFRTRLVFWYTLLLTVTVLILGVVIVTVSRASILNTIDVVLEKTSTAVVNVIRLTPPTADDAAAVVLSLISDAPLHTPDTSVQIWQTWDDNGTITPRLLEASEKLTSPAMALDPANLTTTVPHSASLIFNGDRLRVLSIPLLDGTKSFGVIQMATSISHFEQMQQSLPPIITLAAVIAIMISLVMSIALAERVIRPIETITQTASHIVNAHDLSVRLPEDMADEELGRLIRVFNHMMERLEHVFNVQQEFIGDISHEMRTPLTTILGHLEIMQRYGVDGESLQSVHQAAERLSRTVNELLLLARADSGAVVVEMAPLDFDVLILEVYEQALHLTKNRTLKIILSPIDAVRVQGNRERLRQLLMNLITNAIKFTPDHGSIRLSLKAEANQAVLEVTDTGIGISEKDQARIYDRFFQADSSRAHRSENDGAGLGLSIAKWVVDIHHGQIVVHSVVGQGTTFRVTLPALPLSANGVRLPELEDHWPTKSRTSRDKDTR